MKETLSFVVVQPHSFLYYREAEKETKVRQSLVGFSVGRVIDPGRRKRAISSAGTNSFFISFQTESCCSFSQQLGVILVHSFIFLISVLIRELPRRTHIQYLPPGLVCTALIALCLVERALRGELFKSTGSTLLYAFFSSIRLCEPNVLFCMLQ